MTISVRHEGRDRFRIQMRQHELVVDQPAPVSGDDGPTPTELFVASLAACAAFFGRRFLARRGVPDGGLAVSCDWVWAPDRTRVDRIDIRLEVPEPLTPELEAGLLRAAERCTVETTIRAQPHITRQVVVPTPEATVQL